MASTHRNSFPWVLGTFAIYARTAETAQQVYERIKGEAGWVEPFGTAATDTGEEVVWVNTRYVECGTGSKLPH